MPMKWRSSRISTEGFIAQEVEEHEDIDRIKSVILTGINPPPEGDENGRPDFKIASDWMTMLAGGTEMVAKLSERALLGLYFLENAPVQIESVPLSRPERREMERAKQKGRDPGQIASIIVIRSSRSRGERKEEPMEVEHSHRWERRGHFAHYHSNNRHYHNRPDLIKPCHKCAYEYAQNDLARKRGCSEDEIPFPNTESPDCIKHWRDPTICGPEGKPLRKKVRVRRKDTKQEAA